MQATGDGILAPSSTVRSLKVQVLNAKEWLSKQPLHEQRTTTLLSLRDSELQSELLLALWQGQLPKHPSSRVCKFQSERKNIIAIFNSFFVFNL